MITIVRLSVIMMAGACASAAGHGSHCETRPAVTSVSMSPGPAGHFSAFSGGPESATRSDGVQSKPDSEPELQEHG
jgi:hypothetical protein